MFMHPFVKTHYPVPEHRCYWHYENSLPTLPPHFCEIFFFGHEMHCQMSALLLNKTVSGSAVADSDDGTATTICEFIAHPI